jgi:uncharacterized membrane protein
MNRRLFWSAVAAVVALSAAVPLLAQDRKADKSEQGALADHKAQEQRERDQAAERAKRREAARAGQDGRDKGRPQKEEEEEKRDPR